MSSNDRGRHLRERVVWRGDGYRRRLQSPGALTLGIARFSCNDAAPSGHANRRIKTPASHTKDAILTRSNCSKRRIAPANICHPAGMAQSAASESDCRVRRVDTERHLLTPYFCAAAIVCRRRPAFGISHYFRRRLNHKAPLDRKFESFSSFLSHNCTLDITLRIFLQ
jgi:hypothetical protein